jgi:zinc transport system substrate-binding protein
MERYMDNVVSQTRQLTIIDASTGIDLLPTHNEYNHDNDNNSHVWMSVKNAIVQVKNIAGKLCSAMPEHTDKIRENEKNYISSLEALDMEIKAELSSFSGTKIITFHEAYDYFARDYGLVIFDLIESSHGNEPSAKKLALLSREIKENDIKALFIEPKYSGTAANTLSTETGVKLYTINPITSGQDSLTAYEDIMRANVKTIRESIS